jgi:hypothetical protein
VHGWFTEAFSQTYTLDAFSPADVFAFLRRWDFPADRRFAERHRIFEHLRANPTLFDMCTNPLVLSMYVAEDAIRTRNSGGGTAVRLPDTRARFYDKVVGELLLYRRSDQNEEPEPAGTQLLVTRQELLGRIALDHIVESDDPANSLTLRRALLASRGLWTDGDAEAALVRLAVDTGIVAVQRRGQTVQFIHLTLCEYLAGRELSERGETELNRVLDDACSVNGRRLWETVVFAVALSKRNLRERALHRLVSNGAPSELILRIVREVQTYDDPAFLQAVTAATTRLAETPMEDWDADWLTQVRLLVSCLADASRLEQLRPAAGLPSQSAWLHDLVRDVPDRLNRVLDLYLGSSPSEAIRVADQLGILDHLLEQVDVLVSAMRHPELVALAMHTVAEGGPAASRWAYLLCEAALRYELVAQLMFEESAPAGIDRLLDPADDAHAWHRIGPVATRFYGAALALATTHTGSAARMIDVVRWVKPRSRPAREPHLIVIMTPVTVTVMINVVITLRDQWIGLGTTGLALVLVGLTVKALVRLGGRGPIPWGTVRTLLNLDPRLHSAPLGTVITRFPDGVVRTFRAMTGRGRLADARRHSSFEQALTVTTIAGPLRVITGVPEHTLEPFPPKQRRSLRRRAVNDRAAAERFSNQPVRWETGVRRRRRPPLR